MRRADKQRNANRKPDLAPAPRLKPNFKQMKTIAVGKGTWIQVPIDQDPGEARARYEAKVEAQKTAPRPVFVNLKGL